MQSASNLSITPWIILFLHYQENCPRDLAFGSFHLHYSFNLIMAAVCKCGSTSRSWVRGGIQDKDSPKLTLHLTISQRCDRPLKFCHTSVCRTRHSMKQRTQKAFLLRLQSGECLLVPSVHWQALSKACSVSDPVLGPLACNDQGQNLPSRDSNIRETKKTTAAPGKEVWCRR